MLISSRECVEALWILRRIFGKLAQVFALADPEDEDDWYRASGDIECEHCGRVYYDHVFDPRDRWLTLICGGIRVKL